MSRLNILFIFKGILLLCVACGPPDEGLRQLDAELQRARPTPGLLANASGPAIRIVGSSTVAPFAETVAEQFGASSIYSTPIVETTGTGGGFKAFCSDRPNNHPSIVNASRPMKTSERSLCMENGINDVIEFAIGFDGIALVNAWGGPVFELSKKDLFRALAAELPTDDGSWIENPNKLWSDIVPSLPSERIRVSGPPPTSGTRDAFLELVMEPGARAFPELALLETENPEAFFHRSHTLRSDGAWLDAGENDTAIIQSLVRNEMALGVLGFSFLSQNSDRVRAAMIGGTIPTFETITSGEYEVSRSLYFYVRADHIPVIPGLADFIEVFSSERVIGPSGFLVDRGLIPLPREARSEVQNKAEDVIASANLSEG